MATADDIVLVTLITVPVPGAGLIGVGSGSTVGGVGGVGGIGVEPDGGVPNDITLKDAYVPCRPLAKSNQHWPSE